MKRIQILMEILQAVQVVDSLCKRGASLKGKSGGKLNTTFILRRSKYMDRWIESLSSKLISKAKQRTLRNAARILMESDLHEEVFFRYLAEEKPQALVAENVVQVSPFFAYVKTYTTASKQTAQIQVVDKVSDVTTDGIISVQGGRS